MTKLKERLLITGLVGGALLLTLLAGLLGARMGVALSTLPPQSEGLGFMSGGLELSPAPARLQNVMPGWVSAGDLQFGAVGDARSFTDGVATAASTTFTSAAGAAFTAADKTKVITIPNGNILEKDSFTGTNATNLTAHTPDVGTAWTAGEGTFAIQSNAANNTVLGSDGFTAYAYDSGNKNVTIIADVTPIANCNVGVIFRYVDVNNFSMVVVMQGPSKLRIYERISGSFFNRADVAFADTAGHTYRLNVNISGTTVKAYAWGTDGLFNGVTYATLTANPTATKHGIYADANTGNTVDNLQVVPSGQSTSFRTTVASVQSATAVTLTAAPPSSSSSGTFWVGTDNTTAIQAALTTGKNTYLPSGTYLTTGGLALAASGQCFAGAGKGLSILQLEANAPDQPILKAVSLDDVVVRDLTVNGDNSEQGWPVPIPINPYGNASQQIGILMELGHRSLVSNCVIHDCGFAGYFNSGNIRGKIKSSDGYNNGFGSFCWGNDNVGFAWQVGTNQNPSYSSAVDCTADSDYSDAFRTYADDITWSGCRATNVRTITLAPIQFAGFYTQDCYRTQIIGCHSEGNSGTGVDLTWGNVVTPSGRSGHVISGCTILGNGGAGIAASADGAAITGNTIRNNGQLSATNGHLYGIWLNPSGVAPSHSVITGNLVADDQGSPTQTDGIRGTISSGVITGNVVIGNSNSQVTIDAGTGNTNTANTTS